jgi:hypothetical protein
MINASEQSEIPAMGGNLYLSVATPMMPSTMPKMSRGTKLQPNNEITPMLIESEEHPGLQYLLPGVTVPKRPDDVKPVS